MKKRIALSVVVIALVIAVSASASSNQRKRNRIFIAEAGQKFGVAATNLLRNVGRLRGPLLEVECTPAPNRLVRVGAYGFALSDLGVSVNRVSASYAPVEVFSRRRRPP